MSTTFYDCFAVGIPKSIRDYVFRLESKHSTKRTDGETGTGLGLMLCQKFMNLNEGSISTETEEGVGTIITLISKIVEKS